MPPPSLAQASALLASRLACRSVLVGRGCASTASTTHAAAAPAPLAAPFSTSSSMPPSVGPTVLLMSGGVESAVLVHHFEHHSHADPVYPLFVDYAQAAADRERKAARAATQAAGGTLLEVDARAVGDQLRALHAPARPHVPVPHRNLLLLSLAASFAPTVGATTVSLALCKDDLEPPPGAASHHSHHPGGGGGGGGGEGAASTPQPYSTASPAFVDAARSLFATLSPPLGLATPLSQLSKAAVVSLGARFPALSLEATWSCAKGGSAHCGVCVQCKARREAFRVAGVLEPEGTYEK